MLVINRTDLAPYVGVDLNVMAEDTARMRVGRPFVSANLRSGSGIDEIAAFIVRKGGLELRPNVA